MLIQWLQCWYGFFLRLLIFTAMLFGIVAPCLTPWFCQFSGQLSSQHIKSTTKQNLQQNALFIQLFTRQAIQCSQFSVNSYFKMTLIFIFYSSELIIYSSQYIVYNTQLYRIPKSLFKKIRMFYIVQNLRSQLIFSPYDMDKLSSDDQILKRLKDRVQGRCHAQHGYIVSLLTTSGKNSYDISVPSVEENGCKVIITYSAITFKAQKNDVIDIIVTDVQEQYIKGKIGHAQVLIPQKRIDSILCQYKKGENIWLINDNNVNYRIQRGSKVRCKCFQVKIQMNFQMKIMAEIDRNLIPHFPY